MSDIMRRMGMRREGGGGELEVERGENQISPVQGKLKRKKRV